MTRPISGTLLSLIAVFVAWQVVSFVFQARKRGVAIEAK
ncbi:Uncharacterised protein [Mycobacterium tuberculosis]|nr:Uncharacterised protein [Mycobacterium tuberculosis]